MASILLQPVDLSSDFNLKEALSLYSTPFESLLGASADVQALNVMNWLVQKPINSWLDGMFEMDPSGLEAALLVASAMQSPATCDCSWLAAAVATRMQKAQDESLVSAVDEFLDLQKQQPELIAARVARVARELEAARQATDSQGSDKKLGMEMCRRRRAGLLPQDALNNCSAGRHGHSAQRRRPRVY